MRRGGVDHRLREQHGGERHVGHRLHEAETCGLDRLHASEHDRRLAEGDRADTIVHRPTGVLVGPAFGDQHEQRFSVVPLVARVGIEGTLPAACRHAVDAVLLGDRLVLDEHPVAHHELHAIHHPHALQVDVRGGGNPHRQLDRPVVGTRPLLERELVVLAQRRGVVAREDRVALLVGELVVVGVDRVVFDGRIRALLRAGILDVDADHAGERRGQVVIAVDALVFVVAILRLHLRSGAGVEAVEGVEIRVVRETAADHVARCELEEGQAADQPGGSHVLDLDHRVDERRVLRHILPHVVELGRLPIAGGRLRRDDPPDRRTGGRLLRGVAAVALVRRVSRVQ